MSSSADWRMAAAAALQDYALGDCTLERIEQGLINLTVKLTRADGRAFILQRLHPVFDASVNDNIARVTAHLRKHRLTTPELVLTRTGALAVTRADGIWRLLTFVDGRALDRLETPAQAHAAGRLLGRFHAALSDFTGALAATRPPVHDFPRHLARLREVLAQAGAHRFAGDVRHATARLLELRGRDVEPTVPRLVHGDPKISNVLFDAAGREAVCLIDLDTLAWMPLPYELGDALRSWCNPHGEDALDACFEIALFEAALAGYAEPARDFVIAEEIGAIVPATIQIHLELAARFLADALEECYFGWNPARYASRGEHNLARARGQLTAAASLAAQASAARAAVEGIFAKV